LPDSDLLAATSGLAVLLGLLSGFVATALGSGATGFATALTGAALVDADAGAGLAGAALAGAAALGSGLAGALVGAGLLEVVLGLLETAGVLAVGLVGVDFVMLVDVVLAGAGATLGAGLLVAAGMGLLVAAGMGLLVAAGMGLLVAAGIGLLVAAGAGFLAGVVDVAGAAFFTD
jgi:hypothetical protein